MLIEVANYYLQASASASQVGLVPQARGCDDDDVRAPSSLHVKIQKGRVLEGSELASHSKSGGLTRGVK
jgi:hypothetical protein